MTPRDLFNRINATVWPRKFKLEWSMSRVDIPRNLNREQWGLYLDDQAFLADSPDELIDQLMEYLHVDSALKIKATQDELEHSGEDFNVSKWMD